MVEKQEKRKSEILLGAKTIGIKEKYFYYLKKSGIEEVKPILRAMIDLSLNM